MAVTAVCGHIFNGTTMPMNNELGSTCIKCEHYEHTSTGVSARGVASLWGYSQVGTGNQSQGKTRPTGGPCWYGVGTN